MKIYFSTSLSQMDLSLEKTCTSIVHSLEAKGHTVFLSDLLFQKLFKSRTSNYSSQTELQSIQAHKKLTMHKKTSDVVILEVSKPSLGIGQEIATALSLGKPVIALFRKGLKPHILKDIATDVIMEIEYTDASVVDELEAATQNFLNFESVRYNFFLSPQMNHYLEWYSKTKKISKSSFIRNLIQNQILEDREYKSYFN